MRHAVMTRETLHSEFLTAIQWISILIVVGLNRLHFIILFGHMAYALSIIVGHC
jgi:hypothetical protein